MGYAVHVPYTKTLFKFIADTLLKEEINKAIMDEDTNIEDVAEEVDIEQLVIETEHDIVIASTDIILNMSSILNKSAEFEVTCESYACPRGFKLKDGAALEKTRSKETCCRPASDCEKCQDQHAAGSRKSWCYSSW